MSEMGEMNEMNESETTEDSLRITRRIDAPVERVWEAFADPQMFASWFRPGTRTCRLDTFDLREGGAFKLAFEPTEDDGYGGPSPSHGVFRKVVPHKEIVMAWNWDFPDEDMNEPESRLVFRFKPVGQGTEVTLVHEGLSSRKSVEGHYGGWSTVLPKLESLLSRAQERK